MYLLLNFLGLVAGLVLSFISSGMETALYRVSRVRMRIRCDRGETRAQWVLKVLDRLDGMVTTILINNNIAAYVATYFVTAQLALWRTPHAELITTALVTPLFFVLTESLPKQIAFNRADQFSLALVRVFAALRLLFAPAVWVLNHMSALLRRLLRSGGDASISRSQREILMEHFSAGVADNLLSEEQSRMARRIMELEGISAGDSMMPLAKLLLLPGGTPRSRALAELSRRNAIAVILTDAAGRPTGEATTLEALIMTPGEASRPIREEAERLEQIRAGAAIPEVLNLFRTRHARYALVTDRGRIVGLITTLGVLDKIAGTKR